MALTVQWCDEFVRVCPLKGTALDADEGGTSALPARLTSFRNGCGSLQLVAGPVPKGETVSVTGAALTGPEAAGLPASAWDCFVEWYHELDGRWYPDALVPQAVTGGSTGTLRKENGVPGQRFAGFWLDLHVPADAAPGAYAGNLTVKAGKDQVAVPVELEVLSGVVPDECTMDVSLNNYADSISSGWPDVRADRNRFATAKYRRVERGVFRTAHDHRAFLHYLPYTHGGYVHGDFAPPLAGEGDKRRVVKWADWDRHFGPYFDGSAFKGTRRGTIPVPRFWTPLHLCWPADFLKFGQPGYAAEWRAVGRQMVDHFRDKGWTRTSFDMFLNHKQRFRFFPWDLEEVRFLPDNDVHRYVRTFWQGTLDWESTKPVRFQYTLGTTWTYHLDIQSDLAEFIDVFIAGTQGPASFHEFTPGLHATGRQIWSCTHSGSIDQPTRATAYVPLMAWMRDLDGFMPRWLTMGGWGGDPLHGTSDRGATTFLYPGAILQSEETFPSLRLKVLRNALQVVEQLQAAAKSDPGGKPAVQDRLSALLKLPRESWFGPPPKYMLKKKPKDWTGADFATEEPPLADWRRISAATWRQVGRQAAAQGR